MALIQHKDASVGFKQQRDNSAKSIIPFIQEVVTLTPNHKIMDIGCGEGGVLSPFLDMGCQCLGVELDHIRVENVKKFLGDYIDKGQLEVINENIYNEEAFAKYHGQFDIIILKDVIEHIPEQEKIIPFLKKYLKPGGHIFFGFPPWYMPHGGHQQICNNKLLMAMPYYHLLPMPIYKGILKLFGEPEGKIRELVEIKETGISIERFERIVKKSNYSIPKRQLYLLNPIYEFKFGWKARKQNKLIGSIPFFRNFLTTCAFYLIKAK